MREGPRDVTGMAARSRVARLSLTALLLGCTAIALLLLAVLLSLRDGHGSREARLPVGLDYSRPAVALFGGAVAFAAAWFVGYSALETAASVRVLARDRRIPTSLSPQARHLRSQVLTRKGVASLHLDELEAPPDALPDPAGLPRRTALRLTVMVPAHNEALTIGATLDSLWAQSRPPDRVLVVADNCTDATGAIAQARGADVFTTAANLDRKAGALNQALEKVLTETDIKDVVMVMDADTVIVDGFLDTAMRRLEEDFELIAVGGAFYGEQGAGLVGQLQRNEYTRYQRHIARRRGRVFVLTGTASLFRAYALRAVADARGFLIPGHHGDVYDTLAMTEDNELTLALKTLGAKMTTPRECRAVTEVMPNLRALWRQRMRWQRGALENLGAYGLTRTTLPYWLQQIGIGYGTIALNSYLFLMLVTLLAADGLQVYWFWFAVGLVFVVERVVTVWRVGWRGRALAAPLVIELAYDLVLQASFVVSLVEIASGRKAGWNYVPREEASS